MQSKKCTVNIPACWHSLQVAKDIRSFIRQTSSGWQCSQEQGASIVCGTLQFERLQERNINVKGVLKKSCHSPSTETFPVTPFESPLCANMYMPYLHLKGVLRATTRPVTPSHCTFKFYNC